MQTVRSVLVLALAALLAGGCQQDSRYRLAVDGPAATPGVPLALDVENRSGPVVLQLDTTLQSPEVFARSMKTGKPSWSAASYTEENGRGVLRVLNAPNEAEPTMQGSSMLMIRTPTVDAVRIRVAGGGVELRGVAPSSIEIESGAFGGPGGSVSVDTFGDITGAVNITTTSGQIDYHVGHGSAGKFEAASANGGVVSLRSRGAMFSSTALTQSRLSGVLNKGENDVKLTTQNGSVNIDIYGPNDKPAQR